MSLKEFLIACEGYADARGMGKKGGKPVKPISRRDFEDLKQRYPDGQPTRARRQAEARGR